MEEYLQNPANLRDVVQNLPMANPEGVGVVPLAYTLATGTTLELPEYETAGFTPDQLAAFEAARALQGSYYPYLQGGYASTLQGIGSMGQALGGTQELAGEIPGVIAPGQEAVSAADLATRLSAEELMASSGALGDIYQGVQGRAQDIADLATLGGLQVEGRFGEQLGAAQDIAGEAVGQGIAGLRGGAETISSEAARAQAELRDAARTGFGVAERAAERTGAIAPTLGEGLSAAEQASAQAAQQGISGLLASGAGARGVAQEAAAGARDVSGRGVADTAEAAERARSSTEAAQRALQEASGFGMSSAKKGISALRGSSAMYTPDMLDPFMNRFEDAAVQQVLADIARQGELREQDIRANAVQAGAFGGSRQAVAEQELGRNILDQMARTAAQMRAQGFESAASRSQQAFEDAKRRAQTAAQLTGQLGQAGAASAASAAQAAGQLGLGAEGLAQTGALQGAELGLSAEQLAAQTGLSAEELGARTAGQAAELGMSNAQMQAANAQALAQTGLSAEQLAGQLGLSAAELGSAAAGQAGQMGMAAGQSQADIARAAAALGMSEAQFNAANAQALAQTGLTVEELAAQTGLSANQLIGQLGLSTEAARQGAATSMANLFQNQAGLGMQGSQLGLSGIQAGLGAQQQAAGIGQGIASLGQQQLGFGQAAQNLGMQDVSMMGQIGQQQQAQTQAELDAQRMNQYQQALMPYQQLAFASDIAIGAPTGITSIMSQPGPSPLSQIAGLATAGAGLYNAFAGAGQ